MLHTNTNQVDIIALTEVLPKVKNFQHTTEVYQIDGYTLFSSDFNHGRGTLIYAKENLGATDFNVMHNFRDCVWCKVSLDKGDKLIIGCMYRSPNSSVEKNNELYDMLKNVCASNPAHILILGDFNSKEINWDRFNCNTNENHPAYGLL